MKKLLISLSVIILLGVLSFFALSYWLLNSINLAHVKQTLASQISAFTGKPTQINGELHWQLLPNLRLQVDDIVIPNPESDADTSSPFASIKQAELSLRLLPLLQKQLEITRLRLNGVHLNLIRNAHGNLNWKPGTATKQSTPIHSAANHSSLQLLIHHMVVSDSSINILDQQHQQALMLTNLSLESENFSFHHKFPVNINFNLTAHEQPWRTRVSISTKVLFSPPQKQIQLTPFVFTATIFSPQFPQGQIPLSLMLNAQLDLNQQIFSIKPLQGKIDSLQFSANFSGKKLFSSPEIRGGVAITSANLQQWLQKLGFTLPTHLKPGVLQKFSVNMQVIGLDSGIALNPLNISLDKSQLSGQLFMPFTQQAGRYNLTLNQINLTDYFGQSSSTEHGNIAVPTLSPLPSLPIATLRKLNLAGKLTIEKFQWRNFKASNMHIPFKANNGLITLKPVSFQAPKGGSTLGIFLNVQNQQPLWELLLNVDNVDTQPLFSSLTNSTILAANGIANMRADLTTRGTHRKTLYKNLNGHLSFTLNHGFIQGLNLVHQLHVTQALVDKKPLPKEQQATTAFDLISASLNINQGVITSNNLLLNSPLLKLTGNGTIDLNHHRIDYQLLARASAPLPNSLLNLQNNIGGAIPLRITGNLDNFKVQPDMTTILRELATGFVNRTINSDKPVNTRVNKPVDKKVQKNIKELGNQLKHLLQ